MVIEFQNILDLDEITLELIRTWRNREDIRKYMLTNHIISKEEHQKWLEKLKTDKTVKAWIIKYRNKPVGFVSLADIDYENKTTDWGLYIADESVRGKGIGKQTLNKLMVYVFEKLKFNKMHTKVLENNPIALNLYQKLGFKIEKTIVNKLVRDGKEIDVFYLTISKDNYRNIK